MNKAEQIYNRERSIEELMKLGDMFKFKTVTDFKDSREGRLLGSDKDEYRFQMCRYNRDGSVKLDMNITMVRKDKMVMMTPLQKEDMVL